MDDGAVPSLFTLSEMALISGDSLSRLRGKIKESGYLTPLFIDQGTTEHHGNKRSYNTGAKKIESTRNIPESWQSIFDGSVVRGVQKLISHQHLINYVSQAKEYTPTTFTGNINNKPLFDYSDSGQIYAALTHWADQNQLNSKMQQMLAAIFRDHDIEINNNKNTQVTNSYLNKIEKGKFKFSIWQEYFQEKLPYHPELRNLYDVRKTLQSLNGVDLRSRVNNDHIKAALFPFAQKTSRNSYKPTKGYMLNLTPWMRNLIKPQQGKVFVGLDWSQQEIGIAAALSGDKNYLDIYNSIDGDVYLALAKKSGSVPKNATKQSHPLERDIFKTIQLGIGYGKGVSSLAGDIYWLHANNNEHINLSKAEAYDVAYEIYHWHKNSFNVYWSWISETIQSARALGFYKSLDGWVYFVDQNTRDTQLLNLPMQSNGAAMLRKAMINCNELQGIEIVCTLHDAIYFTCDEGTTDKVIERVKQCMDNACTDLLNNKIKIKVDASIYHHQSGYTSDKGQALLNIVQSAISSMDEDKAA